MTRSRPDDSSPERFAIEVPDGAERSRLRRRVFPIILVALTLLHLVPIWAYPYFPSTDGPSHLANAWVLHKWFDGPGIYHDNYLLNATPFPNWFSHSTLALLMFVAPPRIAEKILLTGYVLLFVLSILYLLGGVRGTRGLHVLLALPFIYNYSLLMGFYNFAISVPLGFFVIGFWWRRREAPLGVGFAVALNLLLLLLYFCHLMSLLLALGAIFGLAALHHGRRVGRTARLACILAPACVLPIHYVLSAGIVTTGPIERPGWQALFGIEALVSSDPRTYHVAFAIAVLYAILIGFTLVQERIPAFRRSPGLEPRDGFLLLAVVFCLLYVIVPPNMAGGGFIHQRIGLYPFLVVLPWLSPRYPKGGAPVVGLAAIALAVIHVGITVAPWAKMNRELDDYTSGIPFVEKGATILPMQCPDEVVPGSRVNALRHAAGYYEMATGAIGLINYEAMTHHFPLLYKRDRNPVLILGDLVGASALLQPWRYPVPIDYALLWYPTRYMADFPRLLEFHPGLRWVFKHYRLVHRGKSLWLLRRKEGPWPPR